MGDDKKGKQVGKRNKGKEQKKRNEVSRKRTAYNRKCNRMIDRFTTWVQEKPQPPVLFLCILKGEIKMIGHPKLVQKLSEGDMTEKVQEFMMDPATMKKNKTQLGFKLSSAKLPVPDDTTDKFLAAKKIPNSYLRNIIVNVVLEGNVGQKGIWGDESFCPSWWPRTVEFTSPNYRNRDGKSVMEPGDLDVIGNALRKHMLAQGMAPSGEMDTEEGSGSYEEDAEPKGEDANESHEEGTGAQENDPPNKRPKMDSPEECEENDERTAGEENDFDSDGEREEPDNPAPEDKFEDEISEEKRKARKSFRSQQRPAMDSLSKKCATFLDELHQKKSSWSDFKTTATMLIHEAQDELLGVAVGLGEQPFYKDLPDKSFEERLKGSVPIGMIPGASTGNGDCLFNSIARLLSLGEQMAPLLRLGSILFAIEHYSHFFDEFKSKLSNLDMAVAFMSQNCSDFAFENRPKDDPSLDDLINHTLSHEIMITSKRGEFSGPLQVQFLSAFINRPVIMDCEFLNRFSYTGRLNPCSCADGHTYGTSVNIMWTNHANDGSGRVNHVIPVYYMRGSRAKVPDTVPDFKLVNENDVCCAQKVLKCIQEKKNAASWIQCKSCHVWYHAVCCGIGERNAKIFSCCTDRQKELKTVLFQWPQKGFFKRNEKKEHHKTVQITLEDVIQTMSHGIGSKTIDFYIRYLQTEVLRAECQRTFVASDVLWRMLKDAKSFEQYAAKNRSLHRNEELLKKRMLIFPCALNPDSWHWVLVVISIENNWLAVLDSLPEVTGPAIRKNIQSTFHRYLEMLYTEAGKATPNFKTFESKVPRQTGGIDCGLMVLVFIKKVLENRFKITENEDQSGEIIVIEGSPIDATNMRTTLLRIYHRIQTINPE